jgi:cobalt-zinc-cadmium efflux system outer membrane protein
MSWNDSDPAAGLRRLGVLALLVLATLPVSAQESGGERLTLSEAVRIALSENPGLAAARQGQGVAQAGIDVARQRPNPELALEAARETPHDSASLSYPFETAGKRRRRIELAEAEARTVDADLGRAGLAVRNRVRRAFYALAAAERQAGLRAEDLRLAQRIRDAAQGRFEAGDAPRLDVLQADLAVVQAASEADGAQGALAAARADLNTLLARPPESPLTLESDLEEGAVPEAGALESLALASSAELAVLERLIEEQAARLALARAERFPDPVLQGGVAYDSPPEFTYGWRAGLSVTLPILSRHKAEIAVEERTLAQRQAEREAARRRIAGEVAQAVALASAARRQTLQYRDEVLPRTVEVESMAEDSYRSGQTGLVALLQALQATREIRLRAIQAGVEYQTALADLEETIGAPLP